MDAAGVTYEGTKAFKQLHSVTSAPIFGFEDTNFGQGLVGGPMIPAADAGRAAASVAVRILSGESAGNITTAPLGFAPPRFDWRELQRWNISEAVLPAGSQMHFREPGLWDRYRWHMAAISSAIILQAGMIFGLLIERRRRQVAELDARQRLVEVAHLNRTATASALSVSIAHELNQPLGAILLNAETAEILLAKEQPDLGQVREILADIRRDDRRAGDVIRHLRGLLRKREAEVQEFELNDAVRGVLTVPETEASKRGVKLRPENLQGSVRVRADPIHLQQVILNLATNGMDAMQASPPGKRVLTVESALAGDSHVEISVLDSGPGIPADKLESIFETFYTTKAQGTGIGLSIARTIVETHGGTIWAENRPAGGAAFRFTLPLAKA